MQGWVATSALLALFVGFIQAPFLHMHECGMEHETTTLVHVHVDCAHHPVLGPPAVAKAIYLDWMPLGMDFWEHPPLAGASPLPQPQVAVTAWTFHERPVRIHDPPNLIHPVLRGPPA